MFRFAVSAGGLLCLLASVAFADNAIWKAPPLKETLPPPTVASLADSGLAFVSRKDIRKDQQTSHADKHRIAKMLRHNPELAHQWGRMVAAARKAGLLSPDILKIARGLVHTLPTTKSATDGPGSETSRTQYLGGNLFVKGGGMRAAGQHGIPTYIEPQKSDLVTHNVNGGGQWRYLERQFVTQVWMHAVTLELFGELANTAIPLSLTPLSVVRRPDGSVISQAEALSNSSLWSDQRRFETAQRAMKDSTAGIRPAPGEEAAAWIKAEAPAEMTYLFRRGRDTLFHFKAAGVRSGKGMRASLRSRLKAAEKEIRTYARNQAAWEALGMISRVEDKDRSRGFLTDQDFGTVLTRRGGVSLDRMKETFVDSVTKFYLTEDEARQHTPRLVRAGEKAALQGWKVALQKVVYSNKKTSLLSPGFRADLRDAYARGLLPMGYQDLPAAYERIVQQQAAAYRNIVQEQPAAQQQVGQYASRIQQGRLAQLGRSIRSAGASVAASVAATIRGPGGRATPPPLSRPRESRIPRVVPLTALAAQNGGEPRRVRLVSSQPRR